MKQQVYFNVEETAKHANQSEARPGEYQAAVGNSGPVLGWVFLLVALPQVELNNTM